MKAYEVIGYTCWGSMYHNGCEPEGEVGRPHPDCSPIFASTELEPLDYCEYCLSKWMDESTPKEREKGPPSAVYIDEERALMEGQND